MIGETILHYRIVDELGRGGMGIVYKAHDTKLDRDVALKFLPPHLAASEDDKARFLQEAKAAATLDHPNICTIYSIEEYEDQIFIAMQLVDGQLLRERMGGLAQKEAIDIGVQMAEGLAAAHEKGIIHRDIKPENIMVRKDGIVQIMDFGLAKIRGASELTKAGTTVGTIRYMSPEQIQGLEVDHRADIFSFGSLLYEMMTGKTPFQGDHDAALMYEIVNVQPQSPGSLKPGIPGELERIILKCLAKDRDERYESARDIAVDLRILQKHSGSGIHTGTKSAGEASAAAPADHVTRKGRLTPMIIGLGSLALFLVALSSWYFLGSSSGDTIASVVVLPFENVGANPDLDYLSEGVTDGIINKVSGIPDLRVIPRSASFRFKGTGRDPQEIGEELDVDAVLSGRVVQRGEGLDISLELIDVREYAQIWGETYKRSMKDLITVQDEISRAVSERLRPDEEGSNIMSGGSETANADAYRLYLQGRFHWNKRTAPDLERALNYFNQAIQLDRNFARAHLGLAETYLLQRFYSDRPSTEIIPLAEAEANRALALNNSLGEAHAALGSISQLDWNWIAAEREFKLAIEKAPGYATAYHWYYIFLEMMGRAEEALEVIKQGAELDPYSPVILVNLAVAHFRRDDIESAERILLNVLDIDPEFFWGKVYHAHVLLMKGENEQAMAILDGMSQRDLSSEARGFLGHHYALLGERGTADDILRSLLADFENRKADPVAIASVYTGLGDLDEAMRWLKIAYEQEQKSGTLPRTRVVPEFIAIQQDARYINLMSKVGL